MVFSPIQSISINHHHPKQSLEESVSVTLTYSTQTYPLTLAIFTGVISSLEFDTLCATVSYSKHKEFQTVSKCFLFAI